KWQLLKQSATGRAQVMLDGIAQGEKVAPGLLQAVTQCDQFLPAVDGNEPVVFQIPGEFLRILEPEIGDIPIGPHERMKEFHVHRGAAVFLPTINVYRSGLTEPT